MVRERFGTQDIRINCIGPVIGAHSGPGTLALFYLGTEPWGAPADIIMTWGRNHTMDEIRWLEVAINTTPERLDEITAKLTAAGMTGLVIEDEGGVPAVSGAEPAILRLCGPGTDGRMRGSPR